MSVQSMIEEMGKNAKDAARHLKRVDRTKKDVALERMAQKLTQRQESIERENQKDLSAARERASLQP